MGLSFHRACRESDNRLDFQLMSFTRDKPISLRNTTLEGIPKYTYISERWLGAN